MAKRKRSQRHASPEDAEPSSAASQLPNSSSPDRQGANDADDKADAVWDAFKEEYHEVLEQLPLYLHRSYALIRELDVQTSGHSDEMLANLQKYIRMREALARPADEQGDDTEPPIDLSHPPRDILPRISCLLDEGLRTTEEKASIAQAVQTTIERHIEILNRSINEQETAIAVGLRHGTHPALLQDFTAPRWQRTHRVVHSPVPELENPYRVRVPTPKPPPEDTTPLQPTPKRGRGHRKQAEKPEAPARSSSGLKLKLKPLASVQKNNEAASDEGPYCFCGGTYFGTMLGCDNSRCKMAWFHLACVGLTKVPDTKKWYCSEKCRKAGSKKKR